MKARLISLAVVVAAIAAAFTTPAAHAASEIGPALGAEVSCDSANNTMTVTPMFGAGDFYSAQSLRYRLFAKNHQSGQTFWLSPNGQWSAPFYHQRIIPWQDFLGNTGYHVIPYAPIASQTFTITGADVSGHFGQFSVYAQYQWWSNSGRWLGPIQKTSTQYANYGWGGSNGGGMSVCLL